jgi:glyoxalase/bleomycin resistance protein/dioxygenase superfamily protein
MLALTFALAAAAAPAPTAAPDWYRSVASVHWIVKDLERIKQSWAKLGVPALADFGDVELTVKRGSDYASSRMRVAMGVLDGVAIYWLQPLDASGVYAEFLKAHGEGIFSLNHQAPSRAALDAEVGRLQALGVGVLQSSDVDTGEGTLRIVHMDTAGEGKWVLGLVHGSVPGAPTSGPALPFGAKLSQFAFVARDLKAVSAYWSRLGLPPIELSRSPIGDRRYRGQPGTFEQEIGFQRHGAVAFEWIHSLAGPTVYDDFLKAHGEGLHHLGLDVAEFDKAVQAWTAAGFPVAQSGTWGQIGKPGSGRYAYLDTEPAGGVYLEALGPHRP